MEMHNGSGQRITETYMIPVTGLNPHLTSTPALEEIGYMGNEVGPEFNFDQGLYYPAATDYYGYYCTGFESPGEWDDRHRFFSSDGQDPQYTTGLQTESSAYVYYTPSYEYAQSSYNPYNPYIPGAVIGFDGPYTGTQEYLANPSYHQPASSPAYFPVVLQPSSDFTPNSSSDPSLYNIGASVASRPDGAGLKYTIPLPSANAQAPSRRVVSGNPTLGSSQPSTHPVHQGAPLLHGLQANAAVSKQPPHGTSGGVPNGNQGTNSSGPMRATDHFSLARVTVPANNGFTNFGSKVHGWTTEDKLKPRFQFNQVLNNENGCTDVVLGERNKGPRTNRSKSQWRPEISVKAHTSKASASNTQGTIIIYADQFNRDDFPVNYQDAKFFVIKSYSEDDVHKSVKYNVWSSTPSGNKRLASAYEDAQRISTGKARKCPVFLFFSVNTSGQFCGVAEMIGPVDFHRDMDFWQQDKWTGSFPVKWHIVKDVPNSSFRHIMLENNENKPVTNSRDTQEITYIPGTNMLNIFKNSPLRTSILDDFVYYEERQRIMQQEKIRLFGRSYNTPLLSALVPNKPTGTVDEPSKAVGKQPDGTVDQPSKADGKQPNGTIDQPLNADGRPPNGTADHPVRADGKLIKPNGPKSQSDEQVSLKHGGTNPVDSKSTNPVDSKKDAKPADGNPTKSNDPKSSVMASLSDEQVSLKHDDTNPADYKKDANPADGKPTKPKGPKSSGKASLSEVQVSLKHDDTNPAAYKKDANPADGKPTKPNGPKSSGKASLSEEQVSLKHEGTNTSDYKKDAKPEPAEEKPTKPNGPKSSGKASLSDEKVSLKHDVTNPADYKMDAKPADGKPTKPNGPKSLGKASLSNEQVSLKHDVTNLADYRKDAKPADGKPTKPNGPKSSGKASLSDEQVSLKHGVTNPADYKKASKPADGKPTKPNGPKSFGNASLSEEQLSLKHDGTNPADRRKDAKSADGKPTKPNGSKSSGKASLSDVQVSLKHDGTNPVDYKKDAKANPVGDANGVNSIMRIGSLSIDTKEGDTNCSGTMVVESVQTDVVTVGSMPVKVNGFGESSSGILTFGTIPIDLQRTKT